RWWGRGARAGPACARAERVWAVILANTVGNLTNPEIAALRAKLAAASPPRPPVLWHAALGPTFRKTQPVRSFLYAQIAGMNAPLPAEFPHPARPAAAARRALRRRRRADVLPDQRRGRAHLARAVAEGPRARAGLALRARRGRRPLALLRGPPRLQPRGRRVPQGASAMKWCRFQSGRNVAYGVIDGTTVTEVTGSPFDSYSKTSNTSILSRVKLLVPVIPPTFYAAGVNYREH